VIVVSGLLLRKS